MFEDEEDEFWEDDGSEAFIDEDSPLKDLAVLESNVRRLVELREAKDEAVAAAEKAKKEFQEFQDDFFEQYEKSPLQGSIRINLGGKHGTVRVTPRATKYGRIVNRDDAVAWMKENGKFEEIVKDDFRMGRVHDIVREHIEQKKPLPPGVDFYTKEYFTISFK